MDLRVVKTRKAIEQTFIRLLGQMPFERITVQNILDEALVNRKTFYSHYDDKYALADQLIEGQLAMFEKSLAARLSHEENEDEFPTVLRDFYLQLQDNRESLLALMDVHTEQHCLRDEMIDVLKGAYRERVARDEDMQMDDITLDYLSSYYAATVISSIRWFLESNDSRAIDVIENVARRRDDGPAYWFVDTPFAQKRG